MHIQGRRIAQGRIGILATLEQETLNLKMDENERIRKQCQKRKISYLSLVIIVVRIFLISNFNSAMLFFKHYSIIV